MNKTKSISKYLSYGVLAVALMVGYFPNIASATQIGARKVVIGSSVADASTTYDFTFTSPTSTVIKSASFAACTTASGACTSVDGFSSSSSTLASQPVNMGSASGWTVNTSVANELRVSNSGNSTAPSADQVVRFSGVKNPSSTNSTFFIRITTYSNSDWTSPIDTGVVAASTAGQVTVTVSIDESLTMVLNNTSVALTQPSIASTGTGTSSMTVATNATSGYSISYKGGDLASGANTLTAMTSAGASNVNTKQFGMNLVGNTTPTVGSNVSGTGTGAVASGYNTSNQFKFVPNTNEVIASAAGPTNSNTYTTSYIANMDGQTAAGAYSTALTYTITANF